MQVAFSSVFHRSLSERGTGHITQADPLPAQAVLLLVSSTDSGAGHRELNLRGRTAFLEGCFRDLPIQIHKQVVQKLTKLCLQIWKAYEKQ